MAGVRGDGSSPDCPVSIGPPFDTASLWLSAQSLRKNRQGIFTPLAFVCDCHPFGGGGSIGLSVFSQTCLVRCSLRGLASPDRQPQAYPCSVHVAIHPLAITRKTLYVSAINSATDFMASIPRTGNWCSPRCSRRSAWTVSDVAARSL